MSGPGIRRRFNDWGEQAVWAGWVPAGRTILQRWNDRTGFFSSLLVRTVSELELAEIGQIEVPVAISVVLAADFEV